MLNHFSCLQPFVNPWTVVCQALLSMEFSGQEYWSGFSSVAQSCPTLCNPMNCSTPGLTVYHQLPEFTQTHVHQVGEAIQPSHPVVPFSFCPQPLPASGSFPMSQLVTSGGQRIGFSIGPSNEHPGLISFRMDWLDPLAVQGTLENIL